MSNLCTLTQLKEKENNAEIETRRAKNECIKELINSLSVRKKQCEQLVTYATDLELTTLDQEDQINELIDRGIVGNSQK